MSCEQTEIYNEHQQEGVIDDALDNIGLHLSFYDSMKKATKLEDIEHWERNVQNSSAHLIYFMQKENTKKYLPEHLSVQIKELLNRDYIALKDYPLLQLLSRTIPHPLNNTLSQT